MYQKGYRLLIELTNGKFTSHMIKNFSQSKWSKPIIPLYVKKFRIDQSEIEKEINSYSCLHELFVRKLKQGARRIIDEEQAVASPVDGVMVDYGNIEANQTIVVKGKEYSIAEMLSNPSVLDKYIHGKYVVLYLSPSHYHRIHSPVSGKVLRRWTLGQKSYPVNQIGLKYGKSPLSKNYRLISEVETERGFVAIVKVGAMFINSIEITDETNELSKGQEFSYFSFGSTVVLLFEKDTFSIEDSLHLPADVRVGEKIGAMTK